MPVMGEASHDRAADGADDAAVRLRTPVVAVLTAAGSGTRLGEPLPKALVDVGGITLLRRAAHGLLTSGVIDAVVVTAPADDHARFAEQVADLAPGRPAADAPRHAGQPRIWVVDGSPRSRQASVFLGLTAALEAIPDAGIVLVHDAARALTPHSVIVRVVQAVRAGHNAVVPALPVTDTITRVIPGAGGDEPQRAEETLDRSCLRAVQTPQAFTVRTLEHAHRLGAARGADEAAAASDDAGLVAAAGGDVVVVPGDPLALKITTPLDLALARLLVQD